MIRTACAAVLVAGVAISAATALAQSEKAEKWAKRYLTLAGERNASADVKRGVALRIDRVAEWCATSEGKAAGVMLLASTELRPLSAAQSARIVYLTVLELYELNDRQPLTERECGDHITDSVLDPDYDPLELPATDLNDTLTSMPLTSQEDT